MQRAQAIKSLRTYGPGWVVVRWAWRFGRPSWTVEPTWYAERALAEYGPEAVTVLAIPAGE